MSKMKTLKKTTKTIAENFDTSRVNALFEATTVHIENARRMVQRTIDSEMVQAYWRIGKAIFEEEQQYAKRAKYGAYILVELSKRLNKKYGRGFGISTLKDMRLFYLTYRDYCSIGHAVRGHSKQFDPNLGWIHYRTLMRIDRPAARDFYTIEASKNHWSGRELERQVDSLLFDRLAKSKDKKGLLRLAKKGQEITNPQDVIKDPVVLEFLGLPESHRLVESKLEEAIINNLKKFLLELGTGFAFVARQKRLTLDGTHYRADLVFYHTRLHAYFIIDCKTKKLTHADLGQMQLYVNYFDQVIATNEDNPTIGLILCTKKSNAMVKYMLGDKAKQIFASKYQFHLPTEAQLEEELKKELKEIALASGNEEEIE